MASGVRLIDRFKASPFFCPRPDPEHLEKDCNLQLSVGMELFVADTLAGNCCFLEDFVASLETLMPELHLGDEAIEVHERSAGLGDVIQALLPSNLNPAVA